MRLGFIGAGNMASALARGIGEPVLVADIDEEKARALAEATGGEALTSAEVADRADAVVLCHKPGQLDEVAGGIDPKAVVSVLAATRIEQLEAAYPDRPVYRFIPNLPVEVRRGVLCYSPGTRAADGPEEDVLALFGRVGTVISLEEPQIEPAMALMSCGPAFYALLAQSFADAGAAHGLAAGDALRMTVETMAGTAAWLDAHELDTADLKVRVATPGGVTEKGLIALDDAGAGYACRAAVDTVVEATR